MRIMTLPCDGIGPEIMSATLAVMDVVNARYDLGLRFHEEASGFASLERHGTTLREEVLDRAKEVDGIILGTQSHMDYPPVAEGGRNVSGAFRVGLDLYANVRPARARPNLPSKAPGMDLVIMREGTECFYPDRNMHRGVGEMMPDPDMALSLRKITRAGSMRICREAFTLAMQRRRKVSAIHKANSFLMTDGLFLECFRATAQAFPEVETEEVIVDAMAALLVRQPETYDVVVATNFYGDILSDLASELSGSLGLAGSINANAETGRCCAQAQHGLRTRHRGPERRQSDVADPVGRDDAALARRAARRRPVVRGRRRRIGRRRPGARGRESADARPRWHHRHGCLRPARRRRRRRRVDGALRSGGFLTVNDATSLRLALIHATRLAIAPIEAASRTLWPEVETVSLLDEGLAIDRARLTGPSPELDARIATLADHAERGGAHGILFTCSAFGRAIEAAAGKASVPVMKPNEAMFGAALDAGGHAALLYTFPPSAPGMEAEFRAEAARRGLDDSTISTVHCVGALAAKQAGDDETHDAIIADTAAGIGNARTIMLAQFSMASALAQVRRTASAPVLASPESAITAMRRRLGQ